MVLSQQRKDNIKDVIKKSLRSKLQNYKPQSNEMPFHFRLLGRDRMALFSFIQSLNTTFGTSIFEPIAIALASPRFAKVTAQYVVGSTIFDNCQRQVTNIINGLTINPKSDKANELILLKSALSGKTNKLKPAKVDLFLETAEGEQYLFDLKTAKPNKGDFQKYKQTLLEWAGIAYTKDKNAKVNTLIAIPYNPYEPQPYQRWTMAGMLDLQNELMVADDFWDFLGGVGTYQELLECFEQAGIELRPEMDTYFARFTQ
ncbi:MAG: TdeIII family type II restriction endonuclease [Puniceicoccales bacterium]|jgi:type II restriction enzyme|nr:TdeIII family type II restriction endonuclease [Puniceicoccales bacterium]